MAVARREERLKELAEECKDAPGEMTWYAGDVGDPAAAVGMVKKAVEAFGRLDVAVNCAGVMDDNTAIADMSDEMLHDVFRINTFGLMYGLREECRQYLTQGNGGVIVNVCDYDPRLDLSQYVFPTLGLLDPHDTGVHEVSMDDLNENQQQIKQALEEFNIKIASIKATVGPTVTLYEIIPEAGIRIAKIKTLE